MAERLTTDTPNGMLFSVLNMFRVKDHEVWLEGYGENGEAITLHDFARKVIRGWDPVSADPLFTGYDLDNDEELDQLMCDCLADGTGTDEGLLAILYNAGWAFAELRERLKEYEDREEDGGQAHWEHIIEQKPEFDAAGRFIGISETPKVRCSHCKQTNKNYESPFCPHCGYEMNEVTEDD